MKTVAKILVAIMVVFTLTGCGAGKDKALIGTWRATIDMSSFINEGAAEATEEFGVPFETDGFTMDMIATFNEDMTYSMGFDVDALYVSLDKFSAEMKEWMIAILEKGIEDQGLDMTVDEMLELSGMNLDDVVEETMAEMTNEMVAELGNFKENGTYTTEDGILYTDSSADEDSIGMDDYTVEGNVLTISWDEEDVDADFPFESPMVFERQ